MIKRIIPIALLGAAMLSLNACNTGGGYKKTENGVQYKIVRDKEGPAAKAGDIVEMSMVAIYKDDKTDTTVFDTYKLNNNMPIQIPLPAPAFKGDFVEALTKLSAGDSAIVLVSIDSLKKQPGMQQLPEFMKSGKFLEYHVSMVSVKSQEAVKKELEQHAADQKVKDEQTLQEYFTQNNLHPQKTTSGVYYTIEKQGTGEPVKNGQVVTVSYTGRTLDGKVFDSNTDPSMGHPEPFTFAVGQGSVIRGWDDALLQLNKGTKAKLFIPSTLAYGAQSPSPAIPADACLMFDIEVLKIEDAPSQPQAGMQTPVQ